MFHVWSFFKKKKRKNNNCVINLCVENKTRNTSEDLKINKPRYLSQGDLHSTEVVVIPEVGAGVIDIVDAQLEILDRLKVVVQSQTLAEGWTGSVLQSLRASELVVKEKKK